MAMSRDTISEVRGLVGELKSVSLPTPPTIPLDDFLLKTEGGADFLDKYNQLMQIMSEYYQQVTDTANVIQDFCDEQEGLNS